MNNVIQDDKVSDIKDVRYKEGHAMGCSVWVCKGPSYGLASTFTAWGNGHCPLTGNANSASEGTVTYVPTALIVLLEKRSLRTEAS